MNINDVFSSDKGACSGCTACYNVCPAQAIKMESDEEGFLYPKIITSQCIDCELCFKICPQMNHSSNVHSERTAYAVTAKNEELCRQSSSGGVFSLLATAILEENGVVFGAAFDDDLSVKHIAIDSVDELHRLRGSKYMQSNLGDCYQQVKTALEQKKKVLFSGTPCQIAGLNAFLKKEYDNLLLIDIICHGAPSPKVWKRYIDEKQKRENIKIEKVNFRDKKYGWKKYCFSYVDELGREHYEEMKDNVFMKGFLANLYLRPSCHMCKEKTFHKKSDITLADFWGIEKLYPNLLNENGVSLVTINTSKGNSMFQNVAPNSECFQVDMKKAVRYNTAAIQSSKKNKNRETFFSAFLHENRAIDDIIEKHYKDYSLRKKCSVFIRKKIKSIISKFTS